MHKGTGLRPAACLPRCPISLYITLAPSHVLWSVSVYFWACFQSNFPITFVFVKAFGFLNQHKCWCHDHYVPPFTKQRACHTIYWALDVRRPDEPGMAHNTFRPRQYHSLIAQMSTSLSVSHYCACTATTVAGGALILHQRDATIFPFSPYMQEDKETNLRTNTIPCVITSSCGT